MIDCSVNGIGVQLSKPVRLLCLCDTLQLMNPRPLLNATSSMPLSHPTPAVVVCFIHLPIPLFRLPKPIGSVPNVEDCLLLLLPQAVILQHPGVDPYILALNLQSRLRRQSIEDKVVITMRTVLITFYLSLSAPRRDVHGGGFKPFLEFLRIFPETLLAFLTRKGLHRCLLDFSCRCIINGTNLPCPSFALGGDPPVHGGSLHSRTIFDLKLLSQLL